MALIYRDLSHGVGSAVCASAKTSPARGLRSASFAAGPSIGWICGAFEQLLMGGTDACVRRGSGRECRCVCTAVSRDNLLQLLLHDTHTHTQSLSLSLSLSLALSPDVKCHMWLPIHTALFTLT